MNFLTKYNIKIHNRRRKKENTGNKMTEQHTTMYNYYKLIQNFSFLYHFVCNKKV